MAFYFKTIYKTIDGKINYFKVKQEITQQLISEVKRINQRYVDIVKTFGEQSELAKTYRKYIDKISTSGLTKSGNLAIKTPSKLTETDIQIIERLKNVQTKGQYKESKQNLYKQLFGKAPTSTQLNQFISELEEIHSFIDENATFIYNVSETLTSALHRSTNLTADEFKEMQKLIKHARETQFDVVETIKRMNEETSEIYD